MSDVEQVLSALLVERAEKVAPRRGHREETLRRSRRRRAANAAAAGVAAIALVAGGTALVQTREVAREVASEVPPAGRTEAGDTTTTGGEYGFRSQAGPEYPWVARGSFRDRTWELRAAAVRLEPGYWVRVTLRIEGLGLLGGTGASTGLRRLDGGLFVNHHELTHTYDHEVAAVFGAADPATASVEVLLETGETMKAHLFEGYDARTGLAADYWVAFLPARTDGTVVARDAGGAELHREVITRREG